MESSYEKHLDTNYVPTVDEAREIQAIVDESAKEITDLDAQIKKLQEQLDVLQAKKERIQTFSDKHKALLSPVRQLTRDILEEIFLACLPTNRNPCTSASEAPMLLTRVCSSWRQTALSAPRIWAKIHIPLPFIEASYFANQIDLELQEELVHGILKLRELAVKEWLGRSSACPLSISIYQTRSWCHPSLSQRFDPIKKRIQSLHESFMRNIIIPHQTRWRDFDIYATDDTLSGLVGLKAENLEVLQTFHVTRQMDFSSGDDHPYQWKDIALLMPSHTTCATLHGPPIQMSDMPAISSISWGNLTNLDLKLNEPSSPLNLLPFTASILRRCESLVSLKLLIVAVTMSDDHALELKQMDTIIFQHLKSLIISLPYGSAGLAFANLLYLPSIRELGVDFPVIHDLVDDQEYGQNIVKSLLRATEDYRTLTIFAPYWLSSLDELVQLLKITPALRCLNVSKHIDMERWPSPLYHSQQIPQPSFRHLLDDGLLRALTPTDKLDSDIICPELEALMFNQWFITGITEASLKEFLIARASDKRVPSLHHVSLFIDRPKQTEPLNTSKISPETDIAAYFWRQQPNFRSSPFEGTEDGPVPDSYIPVECYNEL